MFNSKEIPFTQPFGNILGIKHIVSMPHAKYNPIPKPMNVK